MKVYTGGGDRGRTSLFSGERISKTHDRVAAYGELDELSAILGALTAALEGRAPQVLKEVQDIQYVLFDIGALLATTPESPSFAALKKIDEETIAALERRIDRLDAELPPLKSFILPGGDMTAAWAHIARTVCRRVERRMTGLAEEEGMEDDLQPARVYINRLSDYFFVLARYCNQITGVPDVVWKR